MKFETYLAPIFFILFMIIIVWISVFLGDWHKIKYCIKAKQAQLDLKECR